ncbi:hypothetical protein [Oligoflexus tunisiensis]|uniref:hypothetical protein n=1 Tax=Oligoflexus tunisiensis TaxID=708132 RepID=UPI00114CB92F|nr:hypothetical protein [Oligoflexus tunisiensis]
MNLKVTQGLVAVGMAMSLAACGPKLQSVSGTDGAEDPDAARRETISVGVNLSEKGFSLAGASSYTMRLEGCASGLTADITNANPSVDVYKFDRDCLVKLTGFTYGGISYVSTTLPSGDPFTTFANNDIATFQESGNPANKLTVVVSSQLNNPITGTEAVSYTFTQFVAGAAETIAKTVVGASHALSVTGTDAANMDITGVTLTAVTTGGAGEFTFKVDCLVPISGTGPNYSCGSNDMTTLKYVLVADTYDGTLEYSEAQSLFTSAGRDVLADDQFTEAPGGFNAFVTGPNQMHNNPNMIFVIQSGGSSYKYFNVDVTKLTYP